MRLARFSLSLFAILLLSPLFGQIVPGRYIVELTSAPVADAMTHKAGVRPNFRGAVATAQRTRVRAQQSDVRTRVEGLSATVRGSVNTVANALFVEATDEQLAKLSALDGVKKIHPVRTYKRLLDQAVVVHKAQEAWDQLGGKANAGLGIKVGIIDTGIEYNHAAFANSGLTVPDGFPIVDSYDKGKGYTNEKIIVARSYVNLLSYRDPDYTIRDHVGHGTALATIIAGMETKGAKATIAGFAPGAQLGVYKVFGSPGYNDDTTDDAILAALDDAVSDGMDIVNLSLGTVYAERVDDDIEVAAVKKATDAGVIVVIAAGNSGDSLNTMSSPGTAPTAITVGATTNNRTFHQFVLSTGGNTVGVPADGSANSANVEGTIVGVGGDGLGCSAHESGEFEGKVVLIMRGTCTFEDKINYAAAAGAVGVVVYSASTSVDPFTMSVGTATLPALMISYSAGTAALTALAGDPSITAILNFSESSLPVAPDRVASFSSCGPNLDNSIKPDLVAVGRNYYSATQTLDSYGDMYDSSGYLEVNGTSFSTPTVAGAAAVVKGARPGLTVDQYRSLLINSAADAVVTSDGSVPLIQRQGAGSLDVLAALNSPLAASPVSISLGTGGTVLSTSTTLKLTNLSGTDDTFTLAAAPRYGTLTPAFESATIDLAAGASATLNVAWTGNDLAIGPQEGYITATSTASGRVVRVPYWYDATDSAPANIVVLESLTSAYSYYFSQYPAVVFRVTDAAGAVVTSTTPTVSVVSGSASYVLYSYDEYYPGVYGLWLQLRSGGGRGPGGGGSSTGTTTFRITAGGVSTDISVTSY